MRFSTITTLVLPALALAAPLASRSDSALVSASSATAILKTLNVELSSSASDINSTIAKNSDKDASIKAVTADLLKMTNSVQDAAQKMGIQMPIVGKVAKREPAMALVAEANGKVVLHAAQYKRSDAVAADATGKTFLTEAEKRSDAVVADASGKTFLTEAEKRSEVVVADANGKAFLSAAEKRSQAVAAEASGKTFLTAADSAIEKRGQAEAVAVDASGKTVLQTVEKRGDDALDLATEMSTAVDTVQSAIDNANSKLGADALKPSTMALFSSMSSLSSGVVQIVSHA